MVKNPLTWTIPPSWTTLSAMDDELRVPATTPQGSPPGPLASLLAHLRPVFDRVVAAAGSASGKLAEQVRSIEWRDLLRRLRADQRPVAERLRAALDDALASPRIQPLRERLWKAWTWAVLHDTVPRAAIARLRGRSLARQQRHEQREVQRMHRREEDAKKREKKDESDRQSYSVYFE